MSALPASPRIAAGEKIYRKIITLCARYNSGEDPGIVMRGWDADLKTLITQKLSRLGICVLVCAPKRKPLQEQGGTNAVILTGPPEKIRRNRRPRLGCGRSGRPARHRA